MFSLFRATKFCAAFIVAATMVAGTPTRSYADTGSVRLKITKVGFIVGVGGGSGVLHFKGRSYRLSISGVSVGTIGVSGMDLVGTASNLRTAADIAGTYSALSAGIAVAGGGKVATLQNANGVVLQVQGSPSWIFGLAQCERVDDIVAVTPSGYKRAIKADREKGRLSAAFPKLYQRFSRGGKDGTARIGQMRVAVTQLTSAVIPTVDIDLRSQPRSSPTSLG